MSHENNEGELLPEGWIHPRTADHGGVFPTESHPSSTKGVIDVVLILLLILGH